MRKDGLSTKIYDTHVTQTNILADLEKPNTTIETRAYHKSGLLREYTDILPKYSNKSVFTREQFYKSYDPEVGLNTATVLGGILVLLVIYVIYRTRCRKKLLKLVQDCSMKYFPDDYAVDDSVNTSSATAKSHVVDAEWISERAKMIWKEREALSRDDEEKCVSVVMEGKANDDQEVKDTDGVLSENVEVEDPETSLPDATDDDFRDATLQWVQNVKELDTAEKHLNGLILRIPQDLLSSSARIRSHFHSLRDYGETSVFESVSHRNKSVPLLVEMQNLVKEEYARRDILNNNTEFSYITRAPLASQEEFGSDIIAMNGPMNTVDRHRTPLDICPIVKVQHYHSRSKRRLTSVSRSSSEDSTGSDASSDVTGKRLVPFGQTKYKRLSTTDNNIHSTRMNQLHIPSVHKNCQLCHSVPNSCPTESFETSL